MIDGLAYCTHLKQKEFVVIKPFLQRGQRQAGACIYTSVLFVVKHTSKCPCLAFFPVGFLAWCSLLSFSKALT